MRILCFGDSNTYGYDPCSYSGDRYSAENRWADILAKKTGWEVLNEGQNGRRIPFHSYDIKRIDGLLAANKPDVLVVMLGTNDLLQDASVSETCGRMKAVLEHVLPFCGQILLVAPPTMKRGEWGPDDHLITASRDWRKDTGSLPKNWTFALRMRVGGMWT